MCAGWAPPPGWALMGGLAPTFSTRAVIGLRYASRSACSLLIWTRLATPHTALYFSNFSGTSLFLVLKNVFIKNRIKNNWMNFSQSW